MIERAVSLGRNGNLVGVLAEPDEGRAIPGAPAMLMWNVGIQHRIGPYRIQVDIARDLARRGFMSLRFDLSGMGDSEARQDSTSDRDRALLDLQEAMSLLERRYGARSFVPIGFCSSVDAAHALALRGGPVVGACFLEGYAWRTRGFWLRYPLRLLDGPRWNRYVARRLRQLKRYSVARAGDDPVDRRREVRSVFARQYPTREQFSADIELLSSRGIRLLFVYVGGDTDFNHQGQFFETIGAKSLPNCEVEYYGGADHTFFHAADRERAVARVGEWASRSFAAESGDAGAEGEQRSA